KHVDETGWKQSGRLCWLWTAVTASFIIHARRGLAGLTALLGQAVTGLLITDRWGAYNRLGVYRRQLCWAHRKREFQGLGGRGAPGKALGEELLCFTEDVFHWWYRVRDGTLSRASLRTYIAEQRPWLRDLLARGRTCGCAKAEALCAGLLEWEPALWAFV